MQYKIEDTNFNTKTLEIRLFREDIDNLTSCIETAQKECERDFDLILINFCVCTGISIDYKVLKYILKKEDICRYVIYELTQDVPVFRGARSTIEDLYTTIVEILHRDCKYVIDSEISVPYPKTPGDGDSFESIYNRLNPEDKEEQTNIQPEKAVEESHQKIQRDIVIALVSGIVGFLIGVIL